MRENDARGTRRPDSPVDETDGPAPGQRPRTVSLPRASTGGPTETGPAAPASAVTDDPFALHLLGSGADPAADWRGRLARPAYAYLRPFAEPLLAALDRPAIGDQERVAVRDRLDALFAVSHHPDGGGEPAAKAASNAHHQAVGERIEARLAATAQDGMEPAAVLAAARAEATAVEAEVGAELEDGVGARVQVDLSPDNQLEADIAIAPNDWRRRAALASAAVASALAVGGAVWAWRRRRAAERAEREARAEQAREPMPIRGGVNHNQDCFLLAVLQLVASAYRDQIDPAPDPDHVYREQLRLAVLDALPLLDSGGPPLDADRVSLLRTFMRQTGVVDTLDRQEDAGETFRRLMVLLRPQVPDGTLTGDMISRRTERTILESRTAAEAADAEPPDDLIDYGPHGRHQSDSVDDAIYVPVAESTGLIEYLGRICGPGVTERFDPEARGAHEWAELDGQAVSMTAVRVQQHFRRLPPVLTVVVQRWQAGAGADGQFQVGVDRRPFRMPEQLSMPVFDGDWPLIKSYRLQAVVYHRGAGPDSGHYWAHRRSGPRWLRADDSRVTADRQSARPDGPVEGELAHDVDHGYLYTYVLEGERRAWWGGLPTGTDLDQGQLPEAGAQAPAAHPEATGRRDATEPAVRTVDHGGGHRALRGGPARPAPSPDYAKASALLPIEDRFELPALLDELTDRLLPAVLHAFTMEVVDPKTVKAPGGPTLRTISLMHGGAAEELIRNLVIWWLTFHPTQAAGGLAAIRDELAAHVVGAVDLMVAQRGQRDIGRAEEDDDAPAMDDDGDPGARPAKPPAQPPAVGLASPVSGQDAAPSGHPPMPPDAQPLPPDVSAAVVATTGDDAADAAADSDGIDEDFFGAMADLVEETEVTVDDVGVPKWLRDRRQPRPRAPGDQMQGVELLGDPAYARLYAALRQHVADELVRKLLTGWFAEGTVANFPVAALLERALGGEDVGAELAEQLQKVGERNSGQVRGCLATLGIAIDASATGGRNRHDRSALSAEEQAVPLWLWTSEGAGHPELVKQLVAHAGDEAVAGLMRTVLPRGTAAAIRLVNVLVAAMGGDRVGAALFQALVPVLRDLDAGKTARASVLGTLAIIAPGHGLAAEEQEELAAVPVVEELHVDATIEEAQKSGWITTSESERVGGMIGRRALAGILARAMKGGAAGSDLSSKLPGTRAVIESVDRGPGKDELGPPLSARSLMVDTNLVDVLVKERGALDAGERELRAQIEAMMIDYNIADLRLTNMNRGETFQHGELIGTEFLLEVDGQLRAIPWHGVPLTPELDHRGAYAEVFDELEERSVGENKGHADRSMLADAFCADTERRGAPGREQQVIPHYATADEGILKPLSTFARGRDQAPLDYRRPGDAKDFFTYLERRTGARVFRPEVAGRSLTVHAIRKPKPVRPDAAPAPDVAAPPEARADQPVQAEPPADPFEHIVVGAHTVRELFELIRGQGYDAVISGGAVRDVVRQRVPNDVDLKSNIPVARLEQLLRERWQATAIAIVPNLRLLQIGEIDVMCGEPDAEPGALDRTKVAAAADFRMNALVLAPGEAPSDPLAAPGDPRTGVDDAAQARLTFVGDPGPTVAMPLRIEAVLALLTREPPLLGRTLKFLGRGYELAPEIFDAIREHAIEIVRALALHDRPFDEKALLLHKCEVSSPEELALLLRRFHFPPEAVREVIPDSVAGRHHDGDVSYSRSVMPRNRGVDELEATWDPARPPELKVDVETGRVYQYRLCARLPPRDGGAMAAEVPAEDKVILDVDCSNHDITGHPSPHYHVYRWLAGKWKKQQSGLSSTGQPGTPPVDGGVFLGPTPWRWTEGLSGGADLVETLRANLGARLPIVVDGEVIAIGGQLRLHRQRLAELHAAGQLAKLLLVVDNLDAGLPWDPDEQIAKDLAGSHKGQQRLRFRAQLDAVVAPFLQSCGVDTHERFEALDEPGRQRLHDLAAGSPRPALREPAARWALAVDGTVADFVQRFELFLAVAGDGDPPEATAVDEALRETRDAVGAAALVAAVAIDPSGDVAAQVRDAAPRLGFANLDAAAYHTRKHGHGGGALADAAAAYLRGARTTVAERDSVEVTTDLDGGTSLVFWRSADKAVVRVGLDGTAHLLTYFTKGK